MFKQEDLGLWDNYAIPQLHAMALKVDHVWKKPASLAKPASEDRSSAARSWRECCSQRSNNDITSQNSAPACEHTSGRGIKDCDLNANHVPYFNILHIKDNSLSAHTQSLIKSSAMLKLPNELLDEIFTYVSQTDHLSLLKACRVLRPCAESIFYSSILIDGSGQLLLLLRTFAARPELASYVKVFTYTNETETELPTSISMNVAILRDAIRPFTTTCGINESDDRLLYTVKASHARAGLFQKSLDSPPKFHGSYLIFGTPPASEACVLLDSGPVMDMVQMSKALKSFCCQTSFFFYDGTSLSRFVPFLQGYRHSLQSLKIVPTLEIVESHQFLRQLKLDSFPHLTFLALPASFLEIEDYEDYEGDGSANTIPGQIATFLQQVPASLQLFEALFHKRFTRVYLDQGKIKTFENGDRQMEQDNI
ncbi:hypothetical protein NA57DRAFT_51440 [Rhizodiscina lignyota]|uniref:F-box domain-containing protein n=1 Tax=Rhizodiscina lignyota TaxID=1504668 RepID=A0A9P4MEM6_9PEZI|nr:hypothetical protein NA57DRAFT_51440 [Rhizodiscina lignyota]